MRGQFADSLYAEAALRMSLTFTIGKRDPLFRIAQCKVLPARVARKAASHRPAGNTSVVRVLLQAYAWFRPGEMTSLLRHIVSPEGRIHFAGDHTSPAPGWMNGAFQSGNRVAREVADRRSRETIN
jgi:monoamine oxidase